MAGVVYCVATKLLYIDSNRVLAASGVKDLTEPMQKCAFIAACSQARDLFPQATVNGYLWVRPFCRMRGLDNDGMKLGDFIKGTRQ
jgi:hypothetical protein